MSDDELFDRFKSLLEEVKRRFEQRDLCDPVGHALLRFVQAQNDLESAIDQAAEGGVSQHVVEAAITERNTLPPCRRPPTSISPPSRRPSWPLTRLRTASMSAN